MLNKVFIEGIIAEQPKSQKAVNGRDFVLLIVICKPEQRQIQKDNKPVMLVPDDVIPVIVFNPSYVRWLTLHRKVGDVIQVEGVLKSPNRKLLVLAQRIKLIKTTEYKQVERTLIKEAERIRHNEYINS